MQGHKSQIRKYVDDSDHQYAFNNAYVISQDNTKATCLLREAWQLEETTGNRNNDKELTLQAMRTATNDLN